MLGEERVPIELQKFIIIQKKEKKENMIEPLLFQTTHAVYGESEKKRWNIAETLLCLMMITNSKEGPQTHNNKSYG